MKRIIDDDLIVSCLAGEADNGELEELAKEMAGSDEVTQDFLAIKNVWDAAVSPQTISSIDVNESLRKTLSEIRECDEAGLSFKRRSLKFIMRFAAVMSLPLLLLSGYLYFNNNALRPQHVAVALDVKAMPGSLVHTLLPDSTEVWMNGGTTLWYHQEGEGRRDVTIEGEAYFKVAKDTVHPFVVTTPSSLHIEAVGTEFNICSYPSDSLTSVTLTEGAVRVVDNSWESSMTPDQTIVYNSNQKKSVLYLGNTEKIVSWKEGNLAFHNEMLKNVYKRIGQIFDVQFDVDKRLQNVILYATFENASLDQILSLIQKSTPLIYSIYEDSEDGTSKKRIKVIAG